MPYDSDLRLLSGARGSCRLMPALHRIWPRLARSAGKIVVHEFLIGVAWPDSDGDEPDNAVKTLRVYISMLRARIRLVQAPESIETIWGEGYILHAVRPAALMTGREQPVQPAIGE